MAQKENQRIALTKKLLQEGLLKLLNTKSLDNISVTELCRVSGINRATFYNHYSSPQDLLNDLERRLTLRMKEIVDQLKTPDQLLSVLEKVCIFFRDNSQTILILHRCHADTDITDVLYELNENFQLYNLGNRYASTLGKETLHLVSVFFYTGCYHLLLEWVRKDLPLSPREVAELMIRLASENFVS